MNESSHNDAINFLRILIAAQPNLLLPRQASAESGKATADFMIGFIRQYSEGLKELQDESSQK